MSSKSKITKISAKPNNNNIQPLISYNNKSSIEVSGSISENTIWDCDTVRVIDNIVIENETILTISPGTRIEFQGYYNIDVKGSINSIGNQDSLITFTINNPDLFINDSTHIGCWNGISFNNTSSLNDSSKFVYSLFEYSKATLELSDKNNFNNRTGGVFYLNKFSKVYIANSIFRNNLAEYGAVISCFIESSPIILNNLFYNNYALKNASILYSIYSNPELTNNTISDNFVLNEEPFEDTFTILSINSKPKYTNNIIRNNQVNTAQFFSNKLFYTNNNNIENTEFISINGNIDLDPLFDLSNTIHPYSLMSNSSCIELGTNGDEIISKFSIHLAETDLEGKDRILNQKIDMGAYEFGTVNINDNYTSASLSGLKLKQNYPNPFNPITKINYKLRIMNYELAEIVVYNSMGQQVWSLPITDHALRVSGSILFDGSKFNSGIYYYSLIVDNKRLDTKKMVLTK